ncbi:MAG: glycosyltransferase, partial [Planctomycetes bacterium]|nr:glycosyltransferase [Planctomycetota bacterium]
MTVVVTAHDAGPDLVARLRRLLDSARFAAVWVMDSASSDGSVAEAASAIPELKIQRFEENVGPCVTRNRGLELATTPLVLWLDDDTEVDAGSVSALQDALLASDDRVMAGPSLRFADRRGIVQYEGGVCHYAGQPHMLHHETPAMGGAPREVDVLTSGCALVRRERVLQVGGFDSHLFFLMEDVELSL